MARTTSMPRKKLPLYQRIFGNLSTGTFPSGFTKRLKPTGTTVFTVDTTVPTDSEDTKSIKLALPTGGNANFIWDETIAPGSNITLQADVRFSVIGSDGNAGKIGIIARASLNGFYTAYIKPNGNLLRISKFTGVGSLTETIIQAQTVTGLTLTVDTWYTIKFQLSGTTLRAKVWATGGTEPSTWRIDTTDGTYTVGESVGLWAYDGTEVCNSYVTNFKSTDIVTRSANAIARVVPNTQYLPTPYMDVDGGSGLPSGWTHYNDGGGSTIVNTIDTTDFVTGGGSHKMTIFNGATTFKNNWTQITSINSLIPAQCLKAGSTFTAFVRYKQLANTFSAITLSASGISDIAIATASGAVGWTTATTKVVLRKTITANLSVNIQCKNTNTTDTATLWIDEIRLYTPSRTAVS